GKQHGKCLPGAEPPDPVLRSLPQDDNRPDRHTPVLRDPRRPAERDTVGIWLPAVTGKDAAVAVDYLRAGPMDTPQLRLSGLARTGRRSEKNGLPFICKKRRVKDHSPEIREDMG